MITDIFNHMPLWTQLLTVWALPSLISSLICIKAFHDDLHNRYRNQAIGAVLFLSICYPVLIFILIFALLSLIKDAIIKHNPITWTERQWHNFGNWTNNQQKRHKMQMKLKQQPKFKPQQKHTHMFQTHPSRTVCGVGNYKEVITSPFGYQVTCPTCLFIMRRDLNGRA